MPYKPPRLAIIGPAQNKPARADAERHTSVAHLLSEAPYDVVLLDLPAAQAGQALRKLRQHSDYGLTLIYCCQNEDTLCEALGDGPAPTDAQLLLEWQTWHARHGQLGEKSIHQRFETRLLAWLWLRQQRQIRAVRNPLAAEHYEYPLLGALAGADQGSQFAVLQLMTQEGYLEAQALVDRLRLCVNCGSGRLNYIDICPDCQSIAIAREPSLHCFVCGHVGVQENFLKDGVLLCPNCLTRLRHIGSDYDRPMENYRCRSCRAFFVDAKVQARCLDCGDTHMPDELRVYEVCSYRLTEAGRLRCRQGLSSSRLQSKSFNALGLISVSSFRYLVDWLIQMQTRYENPGFSLLGLRFVNFEQALDNLGEQRANLLVDNLVDRMVAGLRTTDRCTRTDDESLWLLLPCTDQAGLNTVKQRINKLNDLFATSGAREIEVRTVSVTAPAELLDREDSELLMARLAGELS